MDTIITVGRQFGSGGHQIGVQLAKELGIPFYDKELIERAAKHSGISKEIIESHEEKPTGSFLFSLVMDTYSASNYPSGLYTDLPLNQKIFLAQFETIKKVAAEGPCVIIGRCADYALEYNHRCLSVFLGAPLELRIKRISALFDISPAKAKERIVKTDKSRASYYNFYTSKKWGASESYNLVVDTGHFGINGTIEMLKKAIEVKENVIIHNISDEPYLSSI